MHGYVCTRKYEKRKRERGNDVNECLMEIERGSRIVLIGYVNGRVGRREVADVVGKLAWSK